MIRYLPHWSTFAPFIAVIVLAFAWGNVLGLLAVTVVAASLIAAVLTACITQSWSHIARVHLVLFGVFLFLAVVP